MTNSSADATLHGTGCGTQVADGGHLVAHDAIERKLFYPACEEVMGLTPDLGEALVEHGVIEFCLYQVNEALGKADFDFKCKVLTEVVDHHVQEEEDDFFPQARKALGNEAIEALGDEMHEAFEDALAEDFRLSLYEHLRQVFAGALKPEPVKSEATPKLLDPPGSAAPALKAAGSSLRGG